ncbi:minor tail protein [Mycobacterium phage Iota]|nr:minor tail protein [Mycobacterium phage BeanWater]QAY08562.1 minor tail protein [Mycobacterium phage Iota]
MAKVATSINETTFYYDYNYPLKLVDLILGLINNRNDPSNPAQQVDPANREWFSQPRTYDDGGTEVITATFKLPLSISELSMDILRMPCVAEAWYQDRSNNWRQVLDMQRVPVRVNVSRSDAKSYFTFSTKVYPIVAKKLQIRLTRARDLALADTPFPVGLRNTLIRRNVYERAQGQQYFEEEQDVLGNVISKYIKDWDAPRAVDDDPFTFWRSAAMPDPSAVASLYLDIRGEEGQPKTVDKIYLDPVYTGQHLNLYYSSDNTVGVRRLNPITVAPSEDYNTDWRISRGRWDISDGIEDSYYRWPMSLGPQLGADAWFGVEWTPDFDPTDGPPDNPVLFEAMNPGGPAFKPSLSYDVGAGQFVLTLSDGTDEYTFDAPLSALFTPFDPLRIVVGWRYDPDTVFISVRDRTGAEVARLEEATSLPQLITFDGTCQMYKFRGLITALVLKLEDYRTSADAFTRSPVYYVDPDPVIPDPNGVVPSTTLDNAVYAYAATAQEHGSGGVDDSWFEDKEWTPIWRNYLAEKGMLFLPQAISAKYLKLEFTNLTEEPYPVYESETEVRYKVFPISVAQMSWKGSRQFTENRGHYLGQGTFVSRNGVRSVNWLSSASVAEAIDALWGTHTPAVSIDTGPSYVTDTMPNASAELIQSSKRTEAGSSYVYRREVLQPYILAEDAYVTTIKAEGLQQLAYFTDVPWNDIEQANPGAVTHVKSTGALPIRGTDWWIYPGQQLRIPASVMSKLTDTSTVTERKFTTETRVRFTTTSVHRYEYKTLKRDAAIAYFAGVREVVPMTSTFIAGEDKPYFDFPHYDTDHFVTTFTRQLESGPTTTQRRLYTIPNRLFERNLMNWVTDNTNAWSWDGVTGRWLRGSARCDLDGLGHTLMSSRLSVEPGEELNAMVSVKWADLEGLDADDVAIRWGVRYYDANSELLTDDYLDDISYTDWEDHLEEDWIDLDGTSTVPDGAAWFRVLLEVTNQASAGTVWFESVKVDSADDTTATIFKSLETQSTFTKVAVDFRDSGLWRGDSMWADIEPDSESIDDTKLAYYTRTIPETIPGGFWGDTTKAWGGDNVEWGSPFAVVSVTVDGNRRYQGKRVLRFRRAAGAGEAGIKVKQWTHFVPLGLFRIGAVFYKPLANDNQITVRLRRLSDGVIVYEETVEAPSGRWHEFKTKFVEIPDSTQQEYEVMLTLEGDEEDELYLADLYTEIANVRYFIRLGASGSFLHEVTDLRYAQDGRAIVTTSTPTNQLSVQAAILSPEAYAYGCRITPSYLK